MGPFQHHNKTESTSSSRLPEKVSEFLRVHRRERDSIYSDLKGLSSDWHHRRLGEFRAAVEGWPEVDRGRNPDDAFVVAPKMLVSHEVIIGYRDLCQEMIDVVTI